LLSGLGEWTNTQGVEGFADSLLKDEAYGDGWLYAWNPLQAKPLVSFDLSYPERAYCPIPMYMLRRASDGLFYDLLTVESVNPIRPWETTRPCVGTSARR
jgi:hypothetical protein